MALLVIRAVGVVGGQPSRVVGLRGRVDVELQAVQAETLPREEDRIEEVLALVNEERAAVGLPALGWHEEAAQVAYVHSFDMDVRGFFSHTNPDGVGPGGRLAAQGIAFDAIGENIAKGFMSPREVVEGWMASSGHRASILSPEFTKLGVGIHTTKHDGPWWTQDFLR